MCDEAEARKGHMTAQRTHLLYVSLITAHVLICKSTGTTAATGKRTTGILPGSRWSSLLPTQAAK